MIRDDTIAAIATPPGSGAVGIVRLSGPEALAIGRRVFDGRPRSRRAVLGQVRLPAGGPALDTCLALYMPGPGSYTGEDVLELQGHGGRSPERVLAAVLAAGARAAEPGEFTLRAFLAGRMDLTQAEAVLALVQARTDEAAQQAAAVVAGAGGGQVCAARRAALETVAYLSARADFPDDDVPLRDLVPELLALQNRLEQLVSGAALGLLRREGVAVAIVGLPNAGKSSLLNRLLRVSRAIVSDTPGTTRDTIAETANILGLPVTFIDTAGIRTATNPIEREGVSRSRAATLESDLVLMVIDASEPADEVLGTLLDELRVTPHLFVLNKSDLAPRLSGRDLPQAVRAVQVSALTGAGIDALERAIFEAATGGLIVSSEPAVLFTLRQKQAAERALEHVAAALAGLQAGTPEDLAAIDLMAAVRALGELTGDDATEDLLDTIFSQFCIGK